MPEQTPFPPARGDEAALFRDVNAELMRTVAGTVGTSSPDVIEDAVAHAWTRFMQYQPDRSRNWRGWLFRVAQHEAWTLEAAQRDHASLDEHERHERQSVGGLPRAHDPHMTNLEVGEAFEILDGLPSVISAVDCGFGQASAPEGFRGRCRGQRREAEVAVLVGREQAEGPAGGDFRVLARSDVAARIRAFRVAMPVARSR